MLSNNMRLNNLVCQVDVFTIGVKFVAQEDVLAFLWSTPMNREHTDKRFLLSHVRSVGMVFPARLAEFRPTTLSLNHPLHSSYVAPSIPPTPPQQDQRAKLQLPVPEFIDAVFVKTSPKRSFSVIQNERFGLVFVKTGSIISGTVLSHIAPLPFSLINSSLHPFWLLHSDFHLLQFFQPVTPGGG